MHVAEKIRGALEDNQVTTEEMTGILELADAGMDLADRNSLATLVVDHADAFEDPAQVAVGQGLVDRATIGAALVQASLDLNKSGIDFELWQNHRFNPELWEPDALGAGTFHPKPGVRASEALLDIFENGERYGFECATAMVVVHYKAILDLIGPERFDRIGTDLIVGPWRYEWDLATVRRDKGSSMKPAAPERIGELRAGDYAYFKNWDVSPAGAAAGWKGENTIYLGKDENGVDLFYGHPFGVTTADKIVEHLNGHRNPGSTTSASMMDSVGRITSGVFKLGLP
jgi:protein-glutamine gamma-glutamyltransferase